MGIVSWVQQAASAIARYAQHAGIPAIVLAAVALVLSFRLAKKMSRLLLEVTLALGVLLALRYFGVIPSLGW